MKPMNLRDHLGQVLWALSLLILLVTQSACQPKPAQPSVVDLSKVIQSVETASGGWKGQEQVKLYTKETLFDLMDGGSDAYFVYGFEKAAVQRFNGAAGIDLMVSLFQVDAPDSAYGLFSANRDAQVAAVGNAGSTSAGRRLSFWQERYFVQITALKPVAPEDLLNVGKAIAAALPKGGETPALVTKLPPEGLSAEPAPLFFHQELSIQDRVWLGAENKLGLGLDTDGVLARYTLAGQPAELVVIEYPGAEKAQKALQALTAGGQDDLLAAVSKGQRLAAVFGQGEQSAAQALLASALK